MWSTGRTGPENCECRLCTSFHKMKRSQWKVQNLCSVWKVLEKSNDMQCKCQIFHEMYVPERVEYEATLKGTDDLLDSPFTPHSVGARQIGVLIESDTVKNRMALEKLPEGVHRTCIQFSIQVHLLIKLSVSLNELFFNEDQICLDRGPLKGLVSQGGNHRDCLQK